MKKKIIRIGCSSFNNAEWKGIFYPEDLPRNKWFEFYTEHFNTYELNSTFYKMPTVKSLQAWYQKAPEHFKFSVKAPKTITHFKKFIDCEFEIATFYKLCSDGLKDKLACVLFQLPPSFDYTPERLQLIIQSMDRNYKNAVEFRNKSWWQPQVFDSLAEHQITMCSVSYPKLPEEILDVNHQTYLRLHGYEKLFYSNYKEETLYELAKNLVANDNVTEAYVYFNNTASKAGIENAITLKKIISEIKID